MKKLMSWAMRKIPRPILQRFSRVAARLAGLLYIGNKVECPVCGHHYREFLPYGVKVRKNALCPHCLSLERHRLLWLYLKERSNLFTASLRVLHIAPEHCYLERFRKMPNLKYTTADLESPWADVKMDVHQIPFDENSFDVVFCNHVMEHVDSDHRAMSEIYRVLSPGGWAIMQSPINEERETTYEDPTITSPEEREKVFGQKDHVREFGKDYGSRMAAAGFKVEMDPFANTLGHEKLERYAIYVGERKRVSIEEMIFVAQKTADR
jgi:SAM-dependent methyltransferase